jgi:hypothetical protein
MMKEENVVNVDFDRSTLSKMETALQIVCESFPERLTGHEARRQVAERIIACATKGSRSLDELTEAARATAARL